MNKTTYIYLTIGIIIIIVIWGIATFISYEYFYCDFNLIESVGVLFSGIALVFIGFTLFYQFKQLKEQSGQLKNQNEDIKNLYELYNKQNRILALTGLLISAQEMSKRLTSDKINEEKNEKLKNEITANLPKYYKELLDEVEKKK